MANVNLAWNRISVSEGTRYGCLTVVSEVDCPPPRKFVCRCDCGEVTEVELAHLRHKHTESCGCKSRNRATKHGGAGSKLYSIWQAMKSRCANPKDRAWKNYGGRGISVCDRWKNSFAAFREDMGVRLPGTTLERIDNDGNYKPSNCRWVTWKEQSRNKRTNHFVTCNGKTISVAEWAERTGLPSSTICGRLSRGWSEEEAITIPALRRKK